MQNYHSEYPKSPNFGYFVFNLSKSHTFEVNYKDDEHTDAQSKASINTMVITLEGASVIKKLMVFKKEEIKDRWNSISEQEKSIEEGISQTDNNGLKLF